MGSPASEPGDAVRVTGWALFGQQTRALLIKNALLAWRNKATTFLQLFASFFFIVLIFAVNKAVTSSVASRTTKFQNVYDPTPKPIPAIPACQSGAFIKSNCYDFLWSGNQYENITTIVKNICANNPGRPIDFATQTLGFATSGDINAWLLANPYMTTGALLFSLYNNKTIAYGVQVNSTAKQVRGVYEDPNFSFQLPLQAAAEREISKFLINNPDLAWTPSLAEFAHPASEILSVVAQTAAVFLFAAAMFNFVIQMSNIVMEKELKLRQTMSTMGLLDSVYWLTWTVWELLLALVSCLLLVCFGMMFQFDFFLNNGFGVLFFLFFLFWTCMTSVAFLISVFLSKSSSANTIGFSMFIVGFIFQLVVIFGFPYDEQFAGFWRVIFSLFPPNLLAIGLKFLGDATATPEDRGIQLNTARQCAPYNANCVITLAGVYAWLFILSIVYFILAVYLDNVVPDVNGVRKSPFFFLAPSFWNGKSKGRRRAGKQLPEPDVEGAEQDRDVAEEELKVKAGEGEGKALSVRGLQKVFPGKRGCCGCCGRRKPDFHAVKGPWFEMEKETLFCLLGPNGAGKSTTINCLTGILPVSAGDGLIYGCSVCEPASMAVIRRTMGVCPQFDVLWDCLSGREHLFLFARIKGLPHSQIPKEVEALLGEVRLEEAGSTRSGSYSGGMKRRLSVAVSLIGNPSIVFLDEPTTGMDPVSRRYVWDIIERAKRGRAIVLTTHSMEEADILGDRIAIMAKGKLRCIGTSIHLKQRFGSGIIVTVGFENAGALKQNGHAEGAANGSNGHAAASGEGEALLAAGSGHGMLHVSSHASLASDRGVEDAKERVKNFFAERVGAEPTEETRSYLKFAIQREVEGAEGATGVVESDAKLTAFFRELKQRRAELGIADLQLSLTTLEEVFLNIARMAELETAAVEGRYDTHVLPSGLTVKVPVGAERVYISTLGGSGNSNDTPSSAHGWVLKVEWQQDENGKLRIFRVSDLEPASEEVAAAANEAEEANAAAAAAAGSAAAAELAAQKRKKRKGGLSWWHKKQDAIVAVAI